MLKVNVGLSRKVGESNYGSRGATVNLEIELDGSLASQPDQLHDRIRQLFRLAKSSIDEELNGHGSDNGSGDQTAAVQDVGVNYRRAHVLVAKRFLHCS